MQDRLADLRRLAEKQRVLRFPESSLSPYHQRDEHAGYQRGSPSSLSTRYGRKLSSNSTCTSRSATSQSSSPSPYNASSLRPSMSQHASGNLEEEDVRPLKHFFHEVGDAKILLRRLLGFPERLRDLQRLAESSNSREKDEKVSNRLKSLVGEVEEAKHGMLELLERMRTTTEALQYSPSHTSEYRVRANLHASLARQFRAALSDVRDSQSRFLAFWKAKQQRLALFLGTPASAKITTASGQHENRLIACSPAQKSMSDDIVVPSSASLCHAQLLTEEVLHLEQSLADVCLIYETLQMRVIAADPCLDSIESAVEAARDFSMDSTAHLLSKRTLTRKRNTRYAYMLAILATLIILTVGPIIR